MNAQASTGAPPIPQSVVMLGASGAVGQEVLRTLLNRAQAIHVTTLGRRPAEVPAQAGLQQLTVDVQTPASYQRYLQGQQAAICTLGVGQPSKMSRAEFVHIDKDVVLAFAVACKQAGVPHFSLLGAVGADAQSCSFYLRTKGELEEALRALQFKRLSLFRPSMILTPSNRYGVSQALVLAIWPKLHGVLRGSWRQYRGLPVRTLGTAIANNLLTPGSGIEILQWSECMALAARSQP